jgi:hypothetical protein
LIKYQRKSSRRTAFSCEYGGTVRLPRIVGQRIRAERELAKDLRNALDAVGKYGITALELEELVKSALRRRRA